MVGVIWATHPYSGGNGLMYCDMYGISQMSHIKIFGKFGSQIPPSPSSGTNTEICTVRSLVSMQIPRDPALVIPLTQPLGCFLVYRF